MKTGEGKTLVATLRGLSQRARRQRRARGHGQRLPGPARRRMDGRRSIAFSASPSAASSMGSTTTSGARQYACDVTYGTNNEFGFDYLRDNMKHSILSEMVQRGIHAFAIVDEVDSILIDEARTPLIISGPVEDSSRSFTLRSTRLIPNLVDADYELDERPASRHPDGRGNEHVEGAAARGRAAERASRSTTSRTSRSCTTSTRRCARTSCSGAIRTTSSRRPGHHHRRVHRAHDGGPALLRGPAPGA